MNAPAIRIPFLSQQLWYVPLLTLAIGLMLARTVVAAQLLDLSGFGEFSAGLLISNTFCTLVCLGLQPKLQRDLPELLVRSRARAGIVLLAQANLVAIVCAGVSIAAILAGVTLAGFSRSVLLIGMIHGLSQQLFLVAAVESRSRGQPLRFAQQNFMRAIGILVVGSAVAYSTRSAAWTLLAEAIASFLVVYVTLRPVFRAVALRGGVAHVLALRHLNKLNWRSAFALLLVSIAAFILLNADRWLGAHVFTAEHFAQYSFAWTILLIGQFAQAVVNASVFTLLARQYATAGLRAAYRTCLKVSGGLLIGGALLAWPAFALFDQATAHWFPEYRPALILAPLFTIVAVLRISEFWSSFLLIAGLEARLVALNLAAAACGTAAWLSWVRPWQGNELHFWEIGLLAALLTVSSYILTAMVSWRIARG